MKAEELEMVILYLGEIEDMAKTGRVGKVKVSTERLLDEIVFNASKAIELLKAE